MCSPSVAIWNTAERGFVSSQSKQIEHGRQLRRRLIARAIGHRAVRELEQQLERAVVFRLAADGELLDQSGSSRAMRSSRRPMSRNRQP